MNLPELAIRRPVTIMMVLVSIVVLGLVALTRLPLAFMPDITEPQLFVQLPYNNASPEQVERMIVRPVEDALGGVKGLQTMWSRCGSNGAGYFVVHFRKTGKPGWPKFLGIFFRKGAVFKSVAVNPVKYKIGRAKGIHLVAISGCQGHYII